MSAKKRRDAISVNVEAMSMTSQIVRKEILAKLLSLRFILVLLLILLLFVASGFVFVHKYRQQMDDYWKETNKNLSDLRKQASQLYELAFYKQAIWRKPKPLTLCAEGFEKSLPNHFNFNIFDMHFPEVKSRSNFILPRFNDIEWVFIISLVLSFVALLLTYDSICGEREAGTLRLMLAGSIARHKVLMGKYAGAMLTLGIPLLLGLLVNLIIVLLTDVVDIGVSDWLRILGIVLLSFTYLSIFVLLGLVVSSRTAHSANSMVILLLVWVGLVILIPSFGRIISNTFHKLPTRLELQRRSREAFDQIYKDVAAEKFGKNAGNYNSNPNSPSINPPARARLFNAVTDSQNRLFEEYHNHMMAQARSGRNFTRISPAVIYQRALEAIAGTGINRCTNLYQQIKRYQGGFKEYIRSKDQEDPDSLHLIFDSKSAAKDWGTMSNKPVSFDTMPKFQEQDPPVTESLKWAIWDIGLLALFNLVFFTAAFVSFLRYDVR